MASCADAYKPFDEGTPATDLNDARYTGTVNRTALSGITEDEANSGTAEATISGFYLQITGNKIESGTVGALVDAQAYKSGSEYYASGEYIDTDGGNITIKETIRFTISSDGNSVEILEYTADVSGEGQNYSFTYKGTLDKDTSSGS